MPEKLPQGWVKTTLGEIRLDKSMGISQEQLRGEKFELYSVPAFSEGKPEVVLGDAIGSNKILVSPGDVLVCKINPRINRAWVVGELHGHRQIASTEWIVFSKQGGLSSDFLRYFFSQDAFRDYLAANVSGVGGSLMRVRPSVVGTYPFTLPPFAEQNRIVVKLNAALSGVERAEKAARRAQERLQRYRAAVLHAAVIGDLTRDWREIQRKKESGKLETGEALLQRLLAIRRTRWEEAELQRLRAAGKEPKDDKWKSRYREPIEPNHRDLPELPDGWCWMSLDQSTFHLTSGSRDWSKYYNRGSGTFLMAQNIRRSGLDLSFRQAVDPPVDDRDRARSQVAKDDILVTIVGANTGDVCIVPRELPEHFVCQSVALMRLAEPSFSRFIWLYLAADEDGQEQWRKMIYGAGRPHLGFKHLRATVVPIPPVAEQTEIVREVEGRLSAADRLATKLEQQVAQARTMRQSLLREAFAGRLVPQDPNDEPASVLLERIRATREAEAQKPKAKRMPKSNSKSKKARRPLLDVLREHNKPMTPEQLFMEAGYEHEFKEAKRSQEIVDRFYFELRELTEAPAKIRQHKGGSNAILLEAIP